MIDSEMGTQHFKTISENPAGCADDPALRISRAVRKGI